MSKIFQLIGIILISTIFLGCGANNYTLQKDKNLFKPNTELVIYRPDKFFGKGMELPIILNQKIIGESISGTAFNTKIKEGVNEFYIPTISLDTTNWVYMGTGVVPMNFQERFTKEKSIKFNSKELPICIKTSVSMNSYLGKLDFEKVDCNIAQKEIKELEVIKFTKKSKKRF